MPIERAAGIGRGGAPEAFTALVAGDGSAGHRMPAALSRATCSLRDLADAAHHLGVLHGRQPGVIELAADHTADPIAAEWLAMAAAAFAAERGYLVTLAAAAGPLPSTPGHAESEAAVTAQRHAVDMLAQSDRPGCAVGAALALALDWRVIRMPLDRAAGRLGLDPPSLALPTPQDTASLLAVLAANLPVERAMMFGAQQLLAQHRGLWDLLEARAEARAH